VDAPNYPLAPGVGFGGQYRHATGLSFFNPKVATAGTFIVAGPSSLKRARKVMSAPFRQDAFPHLVEESARIALDFLDRSGEADDPLETAHFVLDRIHFMIAQGQRHRLVLANRAIAAFQQYRKTRTIETSLFSRG
jgi:hypothetical protein